MAELGRDDAKQSHEPASRLLIAVRAWTEKRTVAGAFQAFEVTPVIGRRGEHNESTHRMASHDLIFDGPADRSPIAFHDVRFRVGLLFLLP